MVDQSPFINTYSKCLREGKYPTRWKVANLVLIPKSGRILDDPSAYRPLCLLDGCGKLLEKTIVQRLRDHMNSLNVISDRQFGFRQRRSTIDALRCLVNAVEGAKRRFSSNNLFVGVLTLDVKNDFNSAPWPRIKDALNRNRVPSYLQAILGDYLSGRSINVTMPDKSTKSFEVSCGVPQG